MKISLDWLSDYIETGLDAERIAEILSDQGFPCEGIERTKGDAVLDIEITSNRGDCLGHIGIARELSAATGRELKMPVVELEESDRSVNELASVRIAEPDLCGRYTARVIEGVTIGPSPDWMVKRLEAVGMRSVNNVVDATNYAMMEMGQPPHAFDYAKIAEGKIIVRKAIAGERIVSIDGSRCELDGDMLVIADPRGPVAVAGVMGGLETEVGDATRMVLLEDAWFDPVSIRTTSRRLALPSEAAFRFERIVDIAGIDWASKRTCRIITQVAGGKAAAGLVDAYPKKPARKEVALRLARLKKVLGIEVPHDQAIRILSALSFQPRLAGDSIVCSVPSWRSDVYREADLIEEVARVYGYSKAPTERKISIEVVPVDPRQKMTQRVGAYLNACGFYETINVTFVEDSVAETFAESSLEKHLGVKDESRKGASLLRQSLIGSLLGVLKTNVNAKNRPCMVFEIADTFLPCDSDEGLPCEEAKLGLVCDSDLRDMSGVIEGLIRSIHRDAEVAFVPADLPWAEAGAKITVNGDCIGSAGIVSKSVSEKFDLKGILPAAAEMSFERLLSLSSGPVKVRPIPRFPAIERDLSIIVGEEVRWSEIIGVVKGKASPELEDVKFVGIYRGKGIDAGRKSVTLSLRFRDEDGTLTHEAVDGLEKPIVEALAEAIGAQLRTV
ncbi:MAG TPA: phenylalanine--tRNA ligase subunit beta [Sedimentisphaerales bacterium]|nr:phenylalanine--tRNA ligase subunit beta [Sedimentisphaerales bacterium]